MSEAVIIPSAMFLQRLWDEIRIMSVGKCVFLSSNSVTTLLWGVGWWASRRRVKSKVGNMCDMQQVTKRYLVQVFFEPPVFDSSLYKTWKSCLPSFSLTFLRKHCQDLTGTLRKVASGGKVIQVIRAPLPTDPPMDTGHSNSLNQRRNSCRSYLHCLARCGRSAGGGERCKWCVGRPLPVSGMGKVEVRGGGWVGRGTGERGGLSTGKGNHVIW